MLAEAGLRRSRDPVLRMSGFYMTHHGDGGANQGNEADNRNGEENQHLQKNIKEQ